MGKQRSLRKRPVISARQLGNFQGLNTEAWIMALIYVSNVDRRSTEATVRSAFEVYGPVANVKLMSGFAIVEMMDDGHAQNAISDLNYQSSWVVRPVAA
jgi:hypothetical protein